MSLSLLFFWVFPNDEQCPISKKTESLWDNKKSRIKENIGLEEFKEGKSSSIQKGGSKIKVNEGLYGEGKLESNKKIERCYKIN